MRIFKRYNTSYRNQDFARNIILHYGEAHTKMYREVLEKLGMGKSLEIGESIALNCYQIETENHSGKISLFGNHRRRLNFMM